MRLSNGRLVRGIFAILVLCCAVSAGGRAEGIWSGHWATTWRDGGASLLLEQQGDRVTGTYPLYGGRVEATAEGSRLEGRWFEGGLTGRFFFVMEREGRSFSGRYDDGEWWTGARSTAGEEITQLALATPRQAFRRFLLHGNLARSGRPDAWGLAMLVVDFTGMPAMARAEQLQRLQDLFGLIDLTIIRASDLPAEAEGNTVGIRLEQFRSDASLTLTMIRDDAGRWRIRMPSQEEMVAARQALLAKRGGRPAAADVFRRLQNPRDTMRSFLEGMADWNGAGRELALSTLDLTAIPEVLRAGQGALTAHYLRRVLDQIGTVGLQAIPNDGEDRTPYLHYSHAAGQIVIAPMGTAADAPWKFTAQTLADISRVFRAIEGLPPPQVAPPGLIPPAPFFTLREAVQAHAPVLLGRLGPIEFWQMIGATLLMAGIVLISTGGAWLLRRGLIRLIGDGPAPPSAFRWSLAIVIALLLASPFPTIIGVPEEARRFLYPLMGIAFTLAAATVLWHLFEIVGTFAQRISQRSAPTADDILYTLLLAAARLGVIVATFLSVAHFLSIPTSGVVAGLGIGGLAFAFAARETLSNVFGAGILVADRPFRRGDWIKSGEIEGAVEEVGIRSTRVRTAQDSLVVVPNGKLSDSTINNLGTRRHRLVKAQLLVTAGGTPERIDAFADAVRERINGDAAFVASRTDVGVSAITETGIELELTTYLDVPSTSAERAARHSLLLDVIRLAEDHGLVLGSGMQPPIAAEAAGLAPAK
jgi:MscS family membrane protein